MSPQTIEAPVLEPVSAAPEPKRIPAAPPVAAPTRYGFIDLLRGVAMVVMIETHVVNAYLPLALKKGSSFFFCLAFMNGLVAPAFLFAAGFSMMIQAARQWDDWLHFRAPFWRQMRRLGFITLVAYYSHLQGFSLSRYLTHWNDPLMWRRTLQVDVLQCIVVSLFVLHLLILLLRKRDLLPWGAALVAVAFVLITPWMWSIDFSERLPLSVALFLNSHNVSLFPIFPWICFVLAGACAGSLFLRSVRDERLPGFMRNLARFGLALIAAGLLLRSAPFTLPGYVNFYTTSPLYAMIRIGVVLFVLFSFYRLEIKGKWIPKPILLAGQESLLVYGVHLWFIYAFLRGRGLGPILGLKMGYAGCFLLSIAIVVAMLFLAKHWHALKKSRPVGVRRGQAVVVLAMVAVFLLN